MKKGMILLMCILTAGCTKPEEKPIEKDKLAISEIFHYEGRLEDTYYPNVLSKRWETIMKEEWQSVHVVMDKMDESAALDFVVDDMDMLQKIKEMTQNTQLIHSQEIEAKNRMALEITVLDKEPVRIKLSNEAMFYSEKDYLAFDAPLSLYEFLYELSIGAKEVAALDFNEVTSNYQSWADAWENSQSQNEEPKNNKSFMIAQFDEEDEWRYVLGLSLFMNEDFNNYQEIRDWRQIVLGLGFMQQEKGYLIYGGTLGAYNDKSEIYFESENDFNYLVSVLVNEHLVELKGKEIFGEAFVFPEMESGVLRDSLLYGGNYNANQKLIQLIPPYEIIGPPVLPSAYILHILEHGNRKEYDILYYLPSYGGFDAETGEWTMSYINENGDRYDSIQGNEEHFRQAHVVLEKNGEHVQFKSYQISNDIFPQKIEENIEGEDESERPYEIIEQRDEGVSEE